MSIGNSVNGCHSNFVTSIDCRDKYYIITGSLDCTVALWCAHTPTSRPAAALTDDAPSPRSSLLAPAALCALP